MNLALAIMASLVVVGYSGMLLLGGWNRGQAAFYFAVGAGWVYLFAVVSPDRLGLAVVILVWGFWCLRPFFALLVGCSDGVDETPEKQNGKPSLEFESDDIERADNASDAVEDYCADAVSEAQRVGCLSHVDESDIP